jgi:hypothetical protein
MKGGKTKQEAHSHQLKLTPQQEATVSKWIKKLTTGGYAPDYRLVRQIANEIRYKRVRRFGEVEYIDMDMLDTLDNRPLSVNWVYRFLKRYPHLVSCQGRRIEASRLNGCTKDILQV